MRSFGGTLTALVVLTAAVAGFALVQGWTTWFEAIGFVSGAICVWLTAKENIWNWPIGLLNVSAYTYVFFQARLYADAGLQIVYFILAILGWYWWLHGGSERTKLKIGHTPLRQWPIIGFVTILATVGMAKYLFTVHDAAPYLDALTTVLSLVAQYLLTRKYIENWLVWIIVDLIYVPLYAWKGLYLTAILYAIFTVMAVGGLREWARLRAELSDATPVTPLWRPVQVALAVGVGVTLWMGWVCWKFEQAYPAATLAIIRASESAEVITFGPGGRDRRVPVAGDPFVLLKAEQLDPFNRPVDDTALDKRQYLDIAFVAGKERVVIPAGDFYQRWKERLPQSLDLP